MGAVRYRTGIDAATGRFATGWAHVEQSLAAIWSTMPGERVMRLGFGTDLRSLLAEDLTPELALRLYDAMVRAAHAHEPEYRLRKIQLVNIAREGRLGVRHSGLYYPEGRLGNYSIVAEAASGAARRLGAAP